VRSAKSVERFLTQDTGGGPMRIFAVSVSRDLGITSSHPSGRALEIETERPSGA